MAYRSSVGTLGVAGTGVIGAGWAARALARRGLTCERRGVIRRLLARPFEDPEIAAQLERLPVEFNEYGVDRFGISKHALLRFYSALAPLYRSYLNVTVFGGEHIPARTRGMVIGSTPAATPLPTSTESVARIPGASDFGLISAVTPWGAA